MTTAKSYRRLDPFQSRSHSLSNHLQQRDPLISVPELVRRAYELAESLPGKARVVALAQLDTGARVSEILKLRARDVQTSGHIFVRAAKRSETRIACSPGLALIKIDFKGHPDDLIFAPFNYYQYRRLIQRYAHFDLPRSQEREAPTNLFRRAGAELARSLSGGDLTVAQRFLGHKSLRSTYHYLKQLRNQNG